tara:strand:+ start:433 stop:2844 length:2412 start_codon:yes stop_codon:yes gene_type:complete
MKIFKKIMIGLAALAVVGFLLKDPITNAFKANLIKNFKYFPETEFKYKELPGSYANTVCQNSHVNHGESVRNTQLLDGEWNIEQGPLNDNIPEQFNSKVQVPGFVSEAVPAFKDVGIESDERDAFWYKKTFVASEQLFAQSHLCIEKAKYGVKVWLNGTALGEHFGAYSVSEYDLSKSIKYGQENELIVRIGSEYTSVPEFIPVGADLEKRGWFPGIWDSVSLVYTGASTIVRTKVEPDIDNNQVKVITTVKNSSENPTEMLLTQQLTEWQSKNSSAEPLETALTLKPEETKVVEQIISMESAQLWSPESPFLYSVTTTLMEDGKASDDRVTRFGMRKFEWKSGEGKGFFLNNKRYYMRGSNIALHRFFEDQDRKLLPWNKEWVKELYSGHMKDFNWNTFRFHNGRAPNFWYDLADEVGFIVVDEYHIFAPINRIVDGRANSINWSLKELEKEYTAWIQENWNHASIGWWDASNETHNPLPYEVVSLVRHLDPTRAWDAGSYRAPNGENDPLEEHPYKFSGAQFLNSTKVDHELKDLDDFSRIPPMTNGPVFRTHDGEGARNHAYINNEYGWLWITRDGSEATGIADIAYDLLAPGVELTAQQRREVYAYFISELTGYWRARRGYAGVKHFVHLSKCSDKDTIPEDWPLKEPSATCDNFVDIPSLTIEAKWQFWAPHAFAPVGINIDRWNEEFYSPGRKVPVPVALFNDTYEGGLVTVTLLTADKEGKVLSKVEVKDLAIEQLEARTETIDIYLPNTKEFVVYAQLTGDWLKAPVLSRRKVGFAHPGVETQLPTILSKAIENK